MQTIDLEEDLKPIEKLEEEESFHDDFAETPPNDIVAYKSCVLALTY